MSKIRAGFEKQLEEAQAKADELGALYQKALADRAEANARVRQYCEATSELMQDIAACKAALAKLSPPPATPPSKPTAESTPEAA